MNQRNFNTALTRSLNSKAGGFPNTPTSLTPAYIPSAWFNSAAVCRRRLTSWSPNSIVRVLHFGIHAGTIHVCMHIIHSNNTGCCIGPVIISLSPNPCSNPTHGVRTLVGSQSMRVGLLRYPDASPSQQQDFAFGKMTMDESDHASTVSAGPHQRLPRTIQRMWGSSR